MREQRNSPSVAAPGEQMEMESFGEGTVSDSQYTTDFRGIARFLSHGRENSVPLRQLEAVRALIFTERLQGVPILSDSGYYLPPASEQEKARFVRSMRHRAKEIQRMADAIEKVWL